MNTNQISENSDALTVAARNGNFEAVRRLLPISDPSVYDYLPLTWASKYGYAEILQELLPVSKIERPGVLEQMMQFAVRDGFFECFKVLFPYTKQIPVNLNGLFSGAAFYRSVDLLKFIAPLVDPKHNDSEAFKNAITGRNADCIEFLAPLSDTRGVDGTRFLVKAVKENNAAGVKALIPYSNPKHNDSEALFAAVENKFLDCARILVGVSDVSAHNSRALVKALQYIEYVKKPNYEIAELLYEGSDLQAVWEQIETPKDKQAEQFKMEQYARLHELITVREQQKMLEKIALEAHAEKREAHTEKRVEQWRNKTSNEWRNTKRGEHNDVVCVSDVNEQATDEPKRRKM